MTVTSVYPSYTASIRSNNQTNWSDLQSSSSGTVEGVFYQVKLECRSWRESSRGFFIFDTSGLPDNATVSAVSFVIPSITARDCEYGNYLQFRHVTTASNTSLTGTDYNIGNFGTLLAQILYSSLAAYPTGDTISLSGYTINLTGYTKIGLTTSAEINNSDPGNNAGQDRFGFDPSAAYLSITYTTPPAVTTGSVTNLTPVSATLGANVTDIGGGTVISRGIVWGLNSNPQYGVDYGVSSAGTTGSFTIDTNVVMLLPGTLYHYRGYVQTENSLQYGSDLTFRTPSGAAIFFAS